VRNRPGKCHRVAVVPLPLIQFDEARGRQVEFARISLFERGRWRLKPRTPTNFLRWRSERGGIWNTPLYRAFARPVSGLDTLPVDIFSLWHRTQNGVQARSLHASPWILHPDSRVCLFQSFKVPSPQPISAQKANHRNWPDSLREETQLWVARTPGHGAYPAPW
jgi:hypothetical protein